MPFKPGVSGNPAGRPKKLLRRVDEVLHAEGVEPIVEVLRYVRSLQKKRGKEAAAAKREAMKIWLELMPYVYARPKELPDDGGEDLARKPTGELLQLVKEKYPELKEKAG